MKRTVIYARVSGDQQRGNYSIPEQIRECVRFIESKSYALVGDQFVDPVTGFDVLSGDINAIPAFVDDYTSTELSRPSLNAVYRFLDNVGFDVLIVYCLDRLARDPYIRTHIELELGEHGAVVQYVKGDYDDSPEGETRKDLDSLVAKIENQKRVERTTRGKRGKARRGKFVGSGGRSIYGYSIDGSAFGGLAVLPENTEVVKRIFSMFVNERYSIRQVARILTSEKIPSPLGKETWGKSTVFRILKQTAYIGFSYYDVHKRKNKNRLELRDKEDWIEFKTTPIIDEPLFYEAQRILDHNRETVRRTPQRFYLLSGMVFCQDCGKPYATGTAKAGKNGRTNDASSYRHREKSGHCCNHQISSRLLEPDVWGEIVKILIDPQNLRRGYEESLEQQEQSLARQKQLLNTLRQSEKKLEQKQMKLDAAYIDPDLKMTKERYLAQVSQINDDLKHVREQKKTVQESLSAIPTPLELESLETFSREIRDSLKNGLDLMPEEKRAILQMLHIKVLVSRDASFRLEGWFDANSGVSSKSC